MHSFQFLYVFLLVVLTNCFGADEPSEEPLSPVLPPIQVGEKTYYVETFFKANWYRAAQHCRYHGMELASINNQEENDKLIEALETLGSGNGTLHRYWTSGNNFAVNGTYFWLSNGQDFQYTYWGPGEPNHPSSKEHCVEVSNWGRSNLMWNDSTCESESYFICEK